MPVDSVPVRAGIGLAVWIGTYLPLRRMVEAVVDTRPRLLAVGLSAPLAFAATMAWQADPWYRYAVLAVIGSFVALYVAVVGLETTRGAAG